MHACYAGEFLATPRKRVAIGEITPIHLIATWAGRKRAYLQSVGYFDIGARKKASKEGGKEGILNPHTPVQKALHVCTICIVTST